MRSLSSLKGSGSAVPSTRPRVSWPTCYAARCGSSERLEQGDVTFSYTRPELLGPRCAGEDPSVTPHDLDGSCASRNRSASTQVRVHLGGYRGLMSQSPYSRQSPPASSPLTARLYDLEYPRSLGVYSTYQEVQSVVDTLADREFPVQSTLIVGTDLKLMERVTGRRTWPKVIGQGVLSGLWMGLFLGLLFMLITPGDLMIVLSSVLMGIVFFTVWSVIGYAMTGGKRDFTSMTSTIPMQYELLVEHKHADQARRILAESGAGPAVAPTGSAPVAQPTPHAAGRFGSPSPSQGGGQHAAPPAQQAGSGRYGAPSAQQVGSSRYGEPSPQQAASPYDVGANASAPGADEQQAAPSQRPPRPSFGRPAGEDQQPATGSVDEYGASQHPAPLGQDDSPAPEQQNGSSPER